MKKSTLVLLPVLVIVTTFFLLKVSDKSAENPKYIFDQQQTITLNNVAESSKTPTSEADYKLKNVGAVSPADGKPVPLKMDHRTLNFFKFLEQLYPESKDIDEHFRKIEDYLLSKYNDSEAGFLFKTYRNYLLCELEIAETIKVKQMNSSDPTAVINSLTEIQTIRRAELGREVADALFGATVKAAEYTIRKAALMNDATLYGIEKEEAIEKLNEDMWGAEAGDINKNATPYTLYREKLKLYKRDIEELESEEAQSAIKKFREEFFPAELIKKLETAEKKRKEEDQRELNYYTLEDEILNSSDLDDDEKTIRLKELQDNLFGVDADRFRERLSLRTDRKRL